MRCNDKAQFEFPTIGLWSDAGYRRPSVLGRNLIVAIAAVLVRARSESLIWFGRRQIEETNNRLELTLMIVSEN